jgi:hypothetical protein
MLCCVYIGMQRLSVICLRSSFYCNALRNLARILNANHSPPTAGIIDRGDDFGQPVNPANLNNDGRKSANIGEQMAARACCEIMKT